tara:strand:- start:195 stop:317 length:123 start_codon:yes stop_codon:yes gene_type:complete
MFSAMLAPYSVPLTIGSQYAMTQRVAQTDLACIALMSGKT